MPFGLTNPPVSFQEMINTIFKHMQGYIWYLDDILIYAGNTEAEHQAIVEMVQQQCVKHELAIILLTASFMFTRPYS